MPAAFPFEPMRNAERAVALRDARSPGIRDLGIDTRADDELARAGCALQGLNTLSPRDPDTGMQRAACMAG